MTDAPVLRGHQLQDELAQEPGFLKTRAGADVVVRNLTKAFEDTEAVRDVSFSVPGGSFLGLLGPSGSGKTTVLRLLAGFETPDGGTIEIGGKEISSLPAYRRDIGVVFQHYALFPHMNVADNIGFSLKQRGLSQAARRERVNAMLELVGLPGFGHRRPAELSGGQQQRVALARALVFAPRVLVMDEPLAALDKRLREQLQKEIRHIQRRLRITTVYITHDQSEAFAMSDQVAIMNSGRIEQIDVPQRLYQQPRSAFVAEFVGGSNIFRGEPVERCAVRLRDGSILRCPPLTNPPHSVALLIRPESMHVVSEAVATAPAPDENAVPGRVLEAIFLGDVLHYRILVGERELSVQRPSQGTAPPIAPGTAVSVSWAVAATVVLP